MFGYALGLLLPCSSTSDLLLHCPEVLKLVADELQQQIGANSSPHVIVWEVCADGRPPSPELKARLNGLLPAARASGPACAMVFPDELEHWLRLSQVVIHLRLPVDMGGESPEQSLLSQRLRHSRPEWQTSDLLIEHGADRCSHQRRYRGQARLPDDAQRRSALQVLQEQLRPSAGEMDPLNLQPGAWLTKRCIKDRTRSDQRLIRQAILLAVLVVVSRWLVSSLAPTVVLLLSGIWLMSRQPLREQSQHWWCLNQLLWVQDSWNRFGLRDCPAEGPRAPSKKAAGEGGLDLNAALRSHAIWLRMQPAPAHWGRAELTDCLRTIADQRQQLLELGRGQRQRQQWLRLLLALAAVMAMVSLIGETSRLAEQLLLLVVMAVASIGLATPIPMLPIDELRQHQSRLEEEFTELERGQRAETLSDPKLRASVEAALQRIGVELVDLCDDTLQTARDRRRWLP